MIQAGKMNYTGIPLYKLTPYEQTAVMDINARAIAWLTENERKVSRELRHLRKHIKLRKEVQEDCRANHPTSEIVCELYIKRAHGETVYCSVVVHTVYRRFEPPEMFPPPFGPKEVAP